MRDIKFTWDYEALGRAAMPVVEPIISEKTEQVASNVKAKLPNNVPVDTLVERNQNGRVVGLVTISHASGLARQAKHGTLTMGCAEAGLEVTRYGERN